MAAGDRGLRQAGIGEFRFGRIQVAKTGLAKQGVLSASPAPDVFASGGYDFGLAGN